jgi:hypothetical protein
MSDERPFTSGWLDIERKKGLGVEEDRAFVFAYLSHYREEAGFHAGWLAHRHFAAAAVAADTETGAVESRSAFALKAAQSGLGPICSAPRPSDTETVEGEDVALFVLSARIEDLESKLREVEDDLSAATTERDAALAATREDEREAENAFDAGVVVPELQMMVRERDDLLKAFIRELGADATEPGWHPLVLAADTLLRESARPVEDEDTP